MKEKIIVVGGYGKVGKVICEELGRAYPYKVFAAGRNFRKAEQFSIDTDRKVLPMQLDVYERISDDVFQDVSLVIMCLDIQSTDFIQMCINRHVDYIDITADYSVIAKIQETRSLQSTAVLSVGLAPGLTNMLVKQGKTLLDEVDRADIYILLGLGEAHGRAAIEWTVDNLSAVYSVVEQGSRKQVTSFSDGLRTDFPAKLGRRTAYRFNFSDQHVLPRTLGIPSVSTRLCFDSAAITNLIALLRWTGMVRLLQHPLIRKKVVDLFEKSHWGSEIYVAKADVIGQLKGRPVRYQGSIYGEKEFYATGRVAAHVAKKMIAGQLPPGVFHMEELFQPAELFSDLSDVITYNEQILHMQ